MPSSSASFFTLFMRVRTEGVERMESEAFDDKELEIAEYNFQFSWLGAIPSTRGAVSRQVKETMCWVRKDSIPS
jgi:hypothetical protein